jgi:hypothetical protein
MLYNVLEFRTSDIFKEYCVAKNLPYINVTYTQNQLIDIGKPKPRVPFCFTILYKITSVIKMYLLNPLNAEFNHLLHIYIYIYIYIYMTLVT